MARFHAISTSPCNPLKDMFRILWKVFCYLPAHWEASVGIRPDEGRATVAENDQHQEELLYLEHHPGAVRDQGNHGGYVVEKCYPSFSEYDIHTST